MQKLLFCHTESKVSPPLYLSAFHVIYPSIFLCPTPPSWSSASVPITSKFISASRDVCMCFCVCVCATSVLNDYKAQLLKTAIITMPVAKTFWHEFTSSPLRATTHTHTNITQIHVSAHIYSNKLRHTHTLVKAARHTNFSLLARTSS